MTSTWFLSQLQMQQPGFWLLVSWLIGLAGVMGLRIWPGLASWANWLAPLRWLIVPYVGLLVGALSPRHMGLSEIDWLAGAGWGMGLILALLGLLWLIQSGDPNLHRSRAALKEPGPASYVVLMSGLQEFHWAFLRGGLWSLLRTLDGASAGMVGGVPASFLAQPAYWAIWIAGVLAVIELLVAGSVRRIGPTDGLIQLFVLLASSVLFLYTRNFWLCWLLHAGVRLLLARSFTARSLPPQSPPTAPRTE